MEVVNSIQRLRIAGLIEGVSFLLLVFIAMPMKHMMGMPLAVKIVGWIHGILFMAFCWLLLQTMITARWKMSQAALVFLAALVPCGPFVIDKRLKAEIAQKETTTPT